MTVTVGSYVLNSTIISQSAKETTQGSVESLGVRIYPVCWVNVTHNSIIEFTCR